MSSTTILLGIFVGVAGLFLTGYYFGHKKILSELEAPIFMLILCCSAVLLGALVMFLGPDTFGRGYAPRYAEPLSARLASGVPYHLVASSLENGDHVLVLQQKGQSDFLLVRVDVPVPPKDFKLVNGVAIAESD